jgi:hypothetical protein
MQSDAAIAFEPKGAGTDTLKLLKAALAKRPAAKRPKLHLAGHSAGSIWHAHLLARWKALGGGPVATLTLFAPAATVALFDATIRPRLGAGDVQALHHFLLTDQLERGDDVAVIYRKSVLYLVSRAYQHPHHEIEILGMESFWKDALAKLPPAAKARVTSYFAPGVDCETRKHTEFDGDLATMNALLRIVRGAPPARPFTKEELSEY